MQPIIVSGTDKIFTKGQHVAFFGRSNVGKSSTINAVLQNKSAAKVSTTPGKTITFNFFDISTGDDQRYLVDLPGYGYARYGANFREKLRRRLIWYLTESGSTVERFCLVLDAKAGLTEIDKSALLLARESQTPVVVLVNKIDKLNQKSLSHLQKELTTELSDYTNVRKVLYYAAKTGQNVNKVQEFLQIRV